MKKKPVIIAHNRGYKNLISPEAGQMKLDEELDHLRVATVDVPPSHARRGLATQLYEAAFAEACRTNKLLVSDSMRSPFAEAFWRKQARKRRAYCRQRGRGMVYMAPLDVVKKRLLEECRKHLPTEEQAKLCVKGRFQSLLATLPRPKYDPGEPHDDLGRGRWPCYQWALDPKKCGSSLAGLPARRRR